MTLPSQEDELDRILKSFGTNIQMNFQYGSPFPVEHMQATKNMISALIAKARIEQAEYCYNVARDYQHLIGTYTATADILEKHLVELKDGDE